MAKSSPDISGLGLEELKALLVQALEEVARLKGLKRRPKLKPSGMEKAAEAAVKGRLLASSSVIPEMPEALSGIVTNAGACCDPG